MKELRENVVWLSKRDNNVRPSHDCFNDMSINPRLKKRTETNFIEKIMLYFVKMQTEINKSFYPEIVTNYKVMKGRTYIIECYQKPDENFNCRCSMPKSVIDKMSEAE